MEMQMTETQVIEPTRLLTVKQAAEKLAMTEGALRWLLTQERGPRSFKIDGRRKFREADLEAYIAAAMGEAASEPSA
jgi:predicted DNA-binding transcriptional regulator AlpA